jgi:two-component system, chemotaxis family, chemotaxis protein CheY
VRKLLIVDDEREIRESLEEFFQDEGFAVATAANGAEALARLKEAEMPCVVLLDLLMPILGGNEVYQAMQKEPRLTGIPVIVMTSDPSRAPSGLLIMKKPMNLARLLSTVRQHCPDCSDSGGLQA